MTTNTKQVLFVIPLLVFGWTAALILDSWASYVIVIGVKVVAGLFIWRTSAKEYRRTHPVSE
jgi:hypothetical protein